MPLRGARPRRPLHNCAVEGHFLGGAHHTMATMRFSQAELATTVAASIGSRQQKGADRLNAVIVRAGRSCARVVSRITVSYTEDASRRASFSAAWWNTMKSPLNCPPRTSGMYSTTLTAACNEQTGETC